MNRVSHREWDSAAYHRLSDNQFAWGLKVLQRLNLRGDETVLDVGCGSGRVTMVLRARLSRGRLIAVDLSEKMVRQARETLRTASGLVWKRCLVAVADATALPLREAVDGVFSTATFHWVKDHERLFRELHTALTPGGWVEAQCGGGPNLERVRGRVREAMNAAEFAPYFAGWEEPWNYPAPEATAERLCAAGFVDVRTSLEPAAFCIQDRQQYRDYLATVTFHQHVLRLPEGLRERFKDAMVEAAAGDWEMDYWRLNISARRINP